MALDKYSKKAKKAKEDRQAILNKQIKMLERNQKSMDQAAEEERKAAMEQQEVARQQQEMSNRAKMPLTLSMASMGASLGPWGALGGAILGEIFGGIKAAIDAGSKGEKTEDVVAQALMPSFIADPVNLADNPAAIGSWTNQLMGSATTAAGAGAGMAAGMAQKRGLGDINAMKQQEAAGKMPEGMSEQSAFKPKMDLGAGTKPPGGGLAPPAGPSIGQTSFGAGAQPRQASSQPLSFGAGGTLSAGAGTTASANAPDWLRKATKGF